jgi:L-fuconolactonase
MAATRPEWLKLTEEAPLDPGLPICDPHHHFWDRPGERYLVEELLQDVRSGHNIVSTVFVECREKWRQDGPQEMRPVGETEFVEGMVGPNGKYGNTEVAAGIVGFADLSVGAAVAPVLEAHLAASPKRFRGIRHSCTWDASPAVKTATPGIPRWLMADGKFREGLTCLQKHGLSFEAWLYHPQLPEVPALAGAVPDLPIVLNHVGGLLGVGPYAGKRQGIFDGWKRAMREVAACPNVVVKLGGLGMIRCGFGWSERTTPPTSAELVEATAPYYLYCIEQFGPDRCMFESNFPVDKLSYGYTVAWNSFKRMTQGFSAGERAALFHDTATRVYRLAS